MTDFPGDVGERGHRRGEFPVVGVAEDSSDGAGRGRFRVVIRVIRVIRGSLFGIGWFSGLWIVPWKGGGGVVAGSRLWGWDSWWDLRRLESQRYIR